MLERCITDKGGHYLFCDTDSMCIVASKSGGSVACPNEPQIKVLTWKEVEQIANRFASLNRYDHEKVRGSILKIEKVNYEHGRQVQLFGYAISTKRYVLYRYDSRGNIVIVDAKAHGLGYLYPPKDTDKDDPQSDWVWEAWHWVLEGEIAAPRRAPDWFSLPAMMRMTVSTPVVLGILKGFAKPFNFLHVPLLFPNLYPEGKDPSNFGLILPFSTDRDRWLSLMATDTRSGEQYPICLLGQKTNKNEVEVKSYGNVMGAYCEHPEAKFVGHDGEPCNSLTRGLLRRSHIVANHHRYVGKETSRRLEQGDDPSMVDFRCKEYSDSKVVADKETRKRIKEFGIREVARKSGINRETVALIADGTRVKASTLATVIKAVQHDEQMKSF